MKKYMMILLTAVATPNLFCMKKCSEHISKADLLKLIEQHDAKNVLHALSHQQATQIIDEDVAHKAQEMHKKSVQNTARAASILLMITKTTSIPRQSSLELCHLENSNKELTPKEKIRTSSLKSHTTHYSSLQKNQDRPPKKQLMHMIKKRDVDGVMAFMGTSGVHFIDSEVITYAQSKSDAKISATSSEEYAILQLVIKNGPQLSKERRKSYSIKRSSEKR